MHHNQTLHKPSGARACVEQYHEVFKFPIKENPRGALTSAFSSPRRAGQKTLRKASSSSPASQENIIGNRRRSAPRGRAVSESTWRAQRKSVSRGQENTTSQRWMTRSKKSRRRRDPKPCTPHGGREEMKRARDEKNPSRVVSLECLRAQPPADVKRETNKKEESSPRGRRVVRGSATSASSTPPPPLQVLIYYIHTRARSLYT